MTPPVMNEAQEKTYAGLNDNYGIAKHTIDDDGMVHFTADDDDTGWIDLNGDWDWDVASVPIDEATITRLTAEADAVHAPAVLAAQRKPPPRDESAVKLFATAYDLGWQTLVKWIETNRPDLAGEWLQEAAEEMRKQGPPTEWRQ
jgi:hypothetical protein